MQRSVAAWTACVACALILLLFNVEHTTGQATPEQTATPSQTAAPQQAATLQQAAMPVSQEASLTPRQIDQLVSPIALYPDALLANVLIGATYPLEVVMAARWVHDNKVSGEKFTQAAAQQSWDESVKALIHAPAVLAIMSKQIDWTNTLGETFLSQQAAVFDSVQRLRKQAMEAGKLQSTAQQTVTVEGDMIYIDPPTETTMYVPYYDTNDAYGIWLWDDYPPYYWPPPPDYSVIKGFFAAAIIAGIWNGCINYPDHHLTINNRVEHFSRRSSRNGEAWRHNPSHRQGVNYARPELQSRYGTGSLPRDGLRSDFRGFSEPRSGQWEGLGRSSGFDGIGSGNDTRGFSDRGYSSRTMSTGGFSGFRGGGMRGGGGRR